MRFLCADLNANRRRMFNSGTIYAVAHASMTELMLFPRNRGSVCGSFHNRIIIIDMAEQPEDAQDICIINGILDGLGFASGADDVGPSQSGQMLRQGRLTE